MRKLRQNVPLLVLVAGLLALTAWRWPRKAETDVPHSPLRNFSAQTWDAQVLAAKQPVLVEFGATWCPVCRAESPLLDSLAKAVSGTAVVGKVDIDHDGPLAQRYGIQATPTLLVFKDGKVLKSFQGYTPDATLRRALQDAR